MTLPRGVRRAMRPALSAAHGAPRTRTLAEQCFAVARAWPQLRCTYVGRGPRARLVCRGELRPSPLSRTYCVRVEYRLGAPPRAFVDNPRLESRPDAAIPHTYPSSGGATVPCLYYPPDGDWADDRLLAHTIVPWLLEWLVFYEVWLTTGTWHGGGVEHTPSSTMDRPAEAGG